MSRSTQATNICLKLKYDSWSRKDRSWVTLNSSSWSYYRDTTANYGKLRRPFVYGSQSVISIGSHTSTAAGKTRYSEKSFTQNWKLPALNKPEADIFVPGSQKKNKFNRWKTGNPRLPKIYLQSMTELKKQLLRLNQSSNRPAVTDSLSWPFLKPIFWF